MKQWFLSGILWLTAMSVYAQVKIGVSGRLCSPTPECGGDSTAFKAIGQNIKAWDWNFGDPMSATKNISTKELPKHLFQTPGSYKITLIATLNNGTKVNTDTTINIRPLPPEPSFGREDTVVCQTPPGVPLLVLDPYQVSGQNPMGPYKYSWYPYGDTTRVVRVDSSGCYSVTVRDSFSGCYLSAKINVRICGEQLPPPETRWYFGNQAGILFKGGNPSAITDSKLNTPEGTSAYTDKKNRLLFYTDGITIYDKDGKPMKFNGMPQDTTKLGGSKTSTQSVLVVQQPGCRSCEFIYYVFTTKDINDSTKVLSYSVVDMRLNGGKGEIIEQNIPLVSPTTERLTSAKNPTDSTYWVISHDYKSNIFRVYHLTKAGLTLSGTYPLGLSQDTPTQGEGQSKISPNGQRFAIVVPGPPRNYVEVFDFADSTGKISNRRIIDLGPAPPKAYGLEFSPDGSKLYVSFQGDTTANPKVASILLQFDLNQRDSTAIANSRTVLDSTTTAIFGSLQFAPDNKIYVAKQGSGSVATIDAPDNPGPAANYNKTGFSLGGKISLLGLPNVVQNDIQQPSGPGISASDTCFGGVTQLQAGPWCETKHEKYKWKYEYNGPTQFSGPTARLQMQAAILATNWDTQLSSQTQTSHRYPRPGSYNVALYITNDCKDTLIIQSLTINPTPTANLGPDINECRTSITLDAKSTVPQSQFVWFLNGRPLPDTLSRITARQSGRYIVVAFIGECFKIDSINVTLRRPLPLNLGQDATICQGNTTSLDAGAGWTNYQWSNGANTQRIPVTVPGTYSVNVRDNTGCQNGDTITIAARPRPTWNATVKKASACGKIDGAITVSNILPTDSYTFTWYRNGTLMPGATSGTLTNLAVGNYTLQLKGTASCDTIARFTINEARPSIQIVGVSGTAPCDDPNNGQININVGTTPDTYTLRTAIAPAIIRDGTFASISTPGSNVGIIRGLPSGDYIIELTDNLGCKTDTSVRINIAVARLVELGPDQQKCTGDSLILDAGTQGNNYLWTTGERTQRIIVKQSGTYRVTVTNTNTQCQTVDELRVTFVPKPSVNAGTPQALCSDAVPIMLTGATPANGTWSGNGVTAAGLFTPRQNLVGIQTLTYSITQGVCTAQATKAITVQQAPQPNLPPNLSFCENVPQRVNATEYPNATYRWSNGVTTPTIEPAIAGTYFLTVTLGNCRVIDTMKVQIFDVPRPNLRPEVPLCVAENATTILDPGTGTGWAYKWTPGGEITRTITISRAGQYGLKVSTNDGCSVSQSSQVIERCEPRIYVPDLFTPNGDGINDALDVYVSHITDFDLKIYNRWGEVVYATDDITQRWDGRYRDFLYPTQSYAWVITYKSFYFPERPAAVKRGAVMLVR